MQFCNRCGAQLKDDAVFCLQCGAQVSQENGDDSEYMQDYQQQNQADYYGYQNQRGNVTSDYGERTREAANQFKDAAKKAAGVAADAVKANVEQRKLANAQNRQNRKIMLAEGETIIRTYNITRGQTPGKLSVTNKRLLFTAASGRSKAFMSTPIDTVGSIDIISGRNMFMLIYGILLLITIIGIIPGIILITKSKSMFICISATNSSPGMVIGQAATGGKATNAIYGAPGPDASLVMSELGAMILDLQQFGDNAIEKWKR